MNTVDFEEHLQTVQRLRAEIERLRAALRDIQLTAPNITTAIEIARAALEGK